MLEFRDLKKEEINVRIQSTNKGGYTTLLLYKDARCDMDILDETVGCMNWKREHTRDNANCIVSIWDEKKSQWISKEDTGTESNTEQEKGLASDSFKRACFNWGIGRELYTAPRISVKGVNKYDVLEVYDIEITDKKITELVIKDATTDKIIFTYDKKIDEERNRKVKLSELGKIMKAKNITEEKIKADFDISGKISELDFVTLDGIVKKIKQSK